MRTTCYVEAVGQVPDRRARPLHHQDCPPRLETSGRHRLAGEIAGALGDANVNIHGFTGTVVGKQVVIHVKLDSKADAAKAVRAIGKLK